MKMVVKCGGVGDVDNCEGVDAGVYEVVKVVIYNRENYDDDDNNNNDNRYYYY